MPNRRATLPIGLLLLTLAGCGPPEGSPQYWTSQASTCDPREVQCAQDLAEGLRVLFGRRGGAIVEVVPRPDAPDVADAPAPEWRAGLPAAPSLFDGLDRAEPPLPVPAGEVYETGPGRYRFEYDPDITEDAALRHRLGFIAGFARFMRNARIPGHPVDLGAAWPTQALMRRGMRDATAHFIERIIQRAEAGHEPWTLSAADLEWARDLRAASADETTVALVELMRRHRSSVPTATLYDTPFLAAQGCLVAVDVDDPDRCVEVTPQDGAPIDGFYARSADAADAILLEQALLALGHPAAPLATTLVGHTGRDWHDLETRAAARHDGFLFADEAAAEAFADAVAARLDADGGFTADGDDIWRAAGSGVRLVVEGPRVAWAAWAAADDGFDPQPFVERALAIAVEPLEDDDAVDDIECAESVPLPCDVRSPCCRGALYYEVNEMLGYGAQTPWIRLRSAAAVQAAQAAGRWSRDRLADHVDAHVRFASGIEETRADDTDAAAADSGAQFAGFYVPDSRTIVVYVPDGEPTESELWRGTLTLVHELAHLWQDSRFGLRARFADAWRSRGGGDGVEGLLVAIEGHAELVEDLFLDRFAAEHWDDADWLAAAQEARDRLRDYIDDLEQPARDGYTALRYTGGLALARDLVVSAPAGDGFVRAPTGERVADALFDDAPIDSADALRDLYGGRRGFPPGGLSLPTGDPEDAAGLITAHRGRLGAWQTALRLTPTVGFDRAVEIAIGLDLASEAVLLTGDGEAVFWFEARADGLRGLESTLDAWGETLAERAGHVYRVVGDDERAKLVVAPDDDLIDRALDGVRVVLQ